MIRLKEVNEEVLYAVEPVVQIDGRDIEDLAKRAVGNSRKRVRICAHQSVADSLHEMFILHGKDCYIAPHKQSGKSKSLHIIYGSADIVVFDEAGAIVDVVRMGDYKSGGTFYFRLSHPSYHTLLVHSDYLMIHESTTGPFSRGDTIYAPWAPREDSAANPREYVERLARDAEKFAARKNTL